MLRSLIPQLALFSIGLAPCLSGQQVPQMTSVNPGAGKIGSVLLVTGVHLDKTKVDEVYLSDHTLDMMVKVLEQSEGAIKFRVPPSVSPGRLQLVVKTTGKDPMILEQPVYITVEEGKEKEKQTTELATASR